MTEKVILQEGTKKFFPRGLGSGFSIPYSLRIGVNAVKK